MALSRISTFVVAVALLTMPAVASAQLQSEGVIYAYMNMRVGSVQQPVIMPLPTEQVRPDLPLQSTIPAAFGLLRNGKPATYGNASVTLSDALLAQERVAVNLDPNADASTFQVIAAETVLTFSALGIETVIFPGWDDEGMTADDVTFATYRAQVPMWQALVGGAVSGADIVLPDGTRENSTDFYARLQRGDRELDGMILDVITGDDRVRAYYLLGVVNGLEVTDYEEAVIPFLEDEDPAYRVAALNALTPSEEESAWDAIVAMMGNDADPQLRAAAAAAVAEGPLDDYRVYEVFYRAASQDSAVRNAAIAEMASMNDPRVIAQLEAFLAHDDTAVQQGAADALNTLQAWGALETAMGNEALTAPIRLQAATSLAEGASGDAQRAGIEFRGMNTVGDVAIASVARLNEMGDAREALERFLRHADPAVGVFAASTLATNGDTEALEGLSDVGTDADVSLDVQYAAADASYAILSGLSASELSRYTDSRDAFLKRSAYRALGALAADGRAGSGAFDTLVQGTSASDPGVRGASARALGSYGTAEALEQIMTLENDPEESVRADVALALGGFPGEAFADTVSPTVVGYVESGDPLVVAGALDTLGTLEQRGLLAVVLDKVRFPDARVRASAMRTAAALADPNDLRPVINAIGAGLRDDDVGNRVLAAQLLGQFNDSLAVLSISQVVNGPDAEVRYAAISALGRTSNGDAAGPLVALLEDPDREIRLAAVDALRALNSTIAIPGVQAQISRESDPVSLEALTALLEHLQTHGS